MHYPMGRPGHVVTLFFLFAISLVINFFSKFFFNIKNLDQCLTNNKKINK